MSMRNIAKLETIKGTKMAIRPPKRAREGDRKMIRCGACEVVITPPLGSEIPGQFADRRVTEVKDELYVKAIAIESDGEALLLVVVDALFVLATETERIRKRIHAFTDISPERIMVSATHTHTGPPIWPGQDEAYLAELTRKAADAAILAYRRRQPARIGFGSGREAGIAFNRRFRMKDGTVLTNPGYQNPQLLEPEGPADPEVVVVRIDDEAGRPLAVVTNFACHPDTVGGTEACADYPGSLSRSLKLALGAQTVSLFVQGASGNVNHHNFLQPRAIAADHYAKMGRILAGEVLRVREKIPLQDGGLPLPLGAARCLFPLVYRQATEEEAEQARQTLQSPDARPIERILAERLLQTMDNPVREAEMEIQAFRIGELAVAGLPGELFAELGLRLKAEAPYAGLIVNTICNGTNTGYVGTREAYANGGYEMRLRNYSRNAAGTGELFVDKALELLRQLCNP